MSNAFVSTADPLLSQTGKRDAAPTDDQLNPPELESVHVSLSMGGAFWQIHWNMNDLTADEQLLTDRQKNFQLAAFRIYVDDRIFDTISATPSPTNKYRKSYRLPVLDHQVDHWFEVSAINEEGTESDKSNLIHYEAVNGFPHRPTSPHIQSVTTGRNPTTHEIDWTLMWKRSTSAWEITRHRIFVDGRYVHQSTNWSSTPANNQLYTTPLPSVDHRSQHRFELVAIDAKDNESYVSGFDYKPTDDDDDDDDDNNDNDNDDDNDDDNNNDDNNNDNDNDDDNNNDDNDDNDNDNTDTDGTDDDLCEPIAEVTGVTTACSCRTVGPRLTGSNSLFKYLFQLKGQSRQ